MTVHDKRDLQLGPPACAHERIKAVYVVEEGGVEYDGWICERCDMQFAPKRDTKEETNPSRELIAMRRDSARYKWLANRVLACDYGDNERGRGHIGWRIRHDLLAHNGQRQPAFMFGESIDKAVDNASDEEITRKPEQAVSPPVRAPKGEQT